MRILAAIVLGGLLGLSTVDVSAWQEPEQQTGTSTEELVNLNTATSGELQQLPGVGPTLAMRIIEYREGNGGFERIEDVMNVRGVGETSFLRMRHLLTVTPPQAQAAERR